MGRTPLTAEQETQLAALRRLLTTSSAKLYGSGKSPGLFPSPSVSSRRSVSEMLEQGLLEVDGDPENSKATCRLTSAGREWVLEQDDPRILLEDLLRATEEQTDELRDLASTLSSKRELLEQQAGAIRAVLARLSPDGSSGTSSLPQPVDPSLLVEAIETLIVSGAAVGPGAAPWTLQRLFTTLRERWPTLTIGQLHDGVRVLHTRGRIRLSPWTGPLYQLPEPALALLIGHEVLYYVDRRHDVAA